MAEVIRHRGTVVAIEGDKVRVLIEQSSACSACQAKSMCMSSDKKEKFIDCTLDPLSGEMTSLPEVGAEVEVTVAQRMGWKAVVIAYILPLIVLVATLAILDMRLDSEALAGVIALCVTGVYFIILRLFRGRLQQQFSFTVRKLEH